MATIGTGDRAPEMAAHVIIGRIEILIETCRKIEPEAQAKVPEPGTDVPARPTEQETDVSQFNAPW